MSSHTLSAHCQNLCFTLNFGEADVAVLTNGVREWMRLRKRGICLTVGSEGLLNGSKSPEFHADVGEAGFVSQLNDLCAFLAARLGRGRPKPSLDDAALVRNNAVLTFGLAESYDEGARVHGLSEVLALVRQTTRERESEQVILVRGGWPDGETVGTGHELAVIVRIDSITKIGAVQLGQLVVGKLKLPRFYLEVEDQVEVYVQA
jgi:hypothetical protein